MLFLLEENNYRTIMGKVEFENSLLRGKCSNPSMIEMLEADDKVKI